MVWLLAWLDGSGWLPNAVATSPCMTPASQATYSICFMNVATGPLASCPSSWTMKVLCTGYGKVEEFLLLTVVELAMSGSVSSWRAA